MKFTIDPCIFDGTMRQPSITINNLKGDPVGEIKFSDYKIATYFLRAIKRKTVKVIS